MPLIYVYLLEHLLQDSRTSEQRDALAMASYVLGQAHHTPVTPISAQDENIATETDKKIKSLRKVQRIFKLSFSPFPNYILCPKELQTMLGFVQEGLIYFLFMQVRSKQG